MVSLCKRTPVNCFIYLLSRFGHWRWGALIPSPHLLVLATSERFLPTWGTFRAMLASESHWLQPMLVLSIHCWPTPACVGRVSVSMSFVDKNGLRECTGNQSRTGHGNNFRSGLKPIYRAGPTWCGPPDPYPITNLVLHGNSIHRGKGWRPSMAMASTS